MEPEQQLKVVEIINRRRPDLTKGSSGEIEIDLDVLDNATLREIQQFVQQALNKAQAKAKKAQSIAGKRTSNIKNSKKKAKGKAKIRKEGGSSSSSESDSEDSSSSSSESSEDEAKVPLAL
jgi:hypothetical protein